MSDVAQVLGSFGRVLAGEPECLARIKVYRNTCKVATNEYCPSAARVGDSG